jgi:hypothetical protein
VNLSAAAGTESSSWTLLKTLLIDFTRSGVFADAGLNGEGAFRIAALCAASLAMGLFAG